MSDLSIEAIPCFRDNYTWCLHSGGKAWLIDPGQHKPVLEFCGKNALSVQGVIITHAHWDHITGLPGLIEQFSVPVIGPNNAAIPYQSRTLVDGERVDVLDIEFEVIASPGHTEDHLCLFSQDPKLSAPCLFSGDTLFSLGCGRIFSSTAEKLYRSLNRLAKLPGETLLYCTHEYTESNLRFALAVEPQNPSLLAIQEKISQLRKVGKPSLPSTINEQLNCNPFLRCEVKQIHDAACQFLQANDANNSYDLNKAERNLTLTSEEVFIALRQWKDKF